MTDTLQQLDDLTVRLREAETLAGKDPERAGSDLTALVADLRAVGAEQLEAEASYLLARVRVSTGAIDEALALITASEQLYHRLGDETSAARTTLGLMATLSLAGRVNESIEAGSRTLSRLEQSPNDPAAVGPGSIAWIAATLRENIGISLGMTGRNVDAIELFEAAEGFHAVAGNEPDRVRVLANRGVALLALGRASSALDCLIESSEAFGANGDDQSTARCLGYQAKALALQGCFDQALTTLEDAEKCLSLCSSSPDLSRIRVVLAEVYVLMGNDAAALILARNAAQELEQFRLQPEAARAVVLAASCQIRVEQQTGAATHTSLALLDHGWQLFAAGDDDLDAARLLLTRGELLGEFDLARDEAVRRAADLLMSSGSDIDRVRLLCVEADVATDEVVEQRLLDDALCIAEDLGLAHFLLDVLERIGALAARQRRTLDAARVAARVAQTHEQLRRTIPEDWLRVHFLDSRRRSLDGFIRSLIEGGLVEEALVLIDERNSATLRDRIEGGLGRPEWRETSLELSQIYSSMTSASPSQMTALRARAVVLEAEAQPERVGLGDDALLDSPREVRRSRGSTAVNFVVDGRSILAIIERPTKVTTVRHVCETRRLRQLSNALAFHRIHLGMKTLDKHAPQLEGVGIDLLEKLHQLLITPILGLLSGDTVLVTLPAEFVNLPLGAALQNGTPLVERVTVVHTPSTTVARLVARSAPRGRSTLAVGIDAPSLPNACAEADEVAALTGGPALTGPAATVDRLRGTIRDFDVVHLATHGLARADDPWRGGLQLADRWVTVGEISGWQLSGQIVVLSACDTGRQLADTGRTGELLGLPYAFLAAGASGVIVNLWSIDDALSVPRMLDLHQQMKQAEPAAALRSMQLRQRALGHDLRSWASSIFIGGVSATEQLESALPKDAT